MVEILILMHDTIQIKDICLPKAKMSAGGRENENNLHRKATALLALGLPIALIAGVSTYVAIAYEPNSQAAGQVSDITVSVESNGLIDPQAASYLQYELTTPFMPAIATPERN